MVIFDVTTPKPKQNKYPTFLPFHKLETLLSPPPWNLRFTASLIYNKRKLQELKDGINTCGKWIILRIIMMEKFNMDLDQFLQFIDKLKKQFKLSSDELVTLLIQK